jgi:hypothetical protein
MADRDRSACQRRGEAITAAVVWLVLGAIVNVAVAWALAVTLNFAVSSNREVTGEVFAAEEAWSVSRDARVGGVHVMWLKTRPGFEGDPLGPSPGELMPSWATSPPPMPAGRTTEMWMFDARGWPMLALACQSVGVHEPSNGGWIEPATQGGIMTGLPPFAFSTGGGLDRVLPFRPIWPGFAINTVLYAAALWLLFAGPFALRRWRRIKRGLCPKCGYDLRGSPHPNPLPEGDGEKVCPECGAAVPSITPPSV